MKRITLYLVIILLLSGLSGLNAQKKADFILPTPWSEIAFNTEVPLPEYPRPQMERSEWVNLNGTWDYMGGKELADPVTADVPPTFKANPEKILVPFVPEADLSGIKRKDEVNLWYKRNITIPENWKGKRVLLNFGAVDRIATVFVNGKKVGSHTGGYTSFSFDITDYLKQGNNTLIVGAYDPNDGKAASGKNGPKGDYTFSSGIWQTVWMEPVEKEHIAQLKLIPDLKNNRLEITVLSDRNDMIVSAIASDNGREVKKADGSTNQKFYLTLTEPKLWSPENPFLYDLKLQLKDKKGKVVDEVKSYFGMRSISLGKVDGVTRTLLNGEFVLQLGLLDQGYWPDGIFTAPTEEALRYDIELTQKTGFNVIRKHIKTEPQRWYYHCDRMGILVWQDMPNIWEPDGVDSVAVRQQFRTEWKEIIDQHISSPSIVTWVPFNENWGAFEVTDITDWTKKYDPSRLVNGNSGYNFAPGYRKAYGDPGNGDFVDLHNYGEINEKNTPKAEENRASSIGEFGGKGLFVRGHLWPVRNNAYQILVNKEILSDTYVMLITEVEQMMNYRGVSAAIYTQTTDVEHEINGLVTYDRKVEKMDFEKVRNINQSIIANSKKLNKK
ncbi:glycoside hydrolase family 2 protein [Prevotella sp. 10(H)]|uniref:glycoside hydrolase family 2 protein n=1 Tax=Prevotella sp. 10(H) TaxID=1158294 RepID=UPI0004A7133F|nr:sugar-binding domain-containing protein [Prevotella sp. 10(H)]